MKELNDLSIKEITQLLCEYQAFCYLFKNSFIRDPELRLIIEEVLSTEDDDELIQDYNLLLESFDLVLTAEDRVLKADWLFREIAKDLDSE